MAWVREDELVASEKSAERAWSSLSKFQARHKRAMHRVGQGLAAAGTAAAIGLSEQYAGGPIELLGTPIEGLVAVTTLTLAAAGVGGETVSEYIGAVGTGAGCVLAYKWGRGDAQVSGDDTPEVGALFGPAKRKNKKNRAGKAKALPQGLQNQGYDPNREAQQALRNLGLAA